MPGDATTLPLPKARLARARRAAGGLASGARDALGAERGAWAAWVALAGILLGSFALVTIAADRPSGLAPTTHVDFFPRWMAGPLGGLWPELTGNGVNLRYIFTGIVVAMFLAYLVLLRQVRHLSPRWVVAGILAAHAIFLVAPPMALTDVFNYINYARMEVLHHLNPYTSIPIVEPHSDPTFALSNWHELLSPYGPLFTMLTFAVVPLGVAGSFWALKVVLMIASLLTIRLVWSCARLLGRDPAHAIALVGLNPIVLVWGLGGDHNDFLMMLCIMLGLYLLLRARAGQPERHPPAGGRLATVESWLLPLSPEHLGAGAAFVTAAAFKASGAVLIPIVLALLLRSRRALVQTAIGMILAALVVGIASLFAFGLHIPDLSTQSRLVTAESVPNLIGLAVGAGGETQTLHTIMTGVLAAVLASCCVQAYRRREMITASGWSSITLLVTLSWVLPWYVLWALPMAALTTSRRLRIATVVVGAYLIVAWAPASGLLWKAIGFHPETTPLGKLHHRYVRELLQ
jgi:hypothetical protein